jgi:hypothetical protein
MGAMQTGDGKANTMARTMAERCAATILGNVQPKRQSQPTGARTLAPVHPLMLRFYVSDSLQAFFFSAASNAALRPCPVLRLLLLETAFFRVFFFFYFATPCATPLRKPGRSDVKVSSSVCHEQQAAVQSTPYCM